MAAEEEIIVDKYFHHCDTRAAAATRPGLGAFRFRFVTRDKKVEAGVSRATAPCVSQVNTAISSFAHAKLISHNLRSKSLFKLKYFAFINVCIPIQCNVRCKM